MNGKYAVKIMGVLLLALLCSGIAGKAQLIPPDPYYELDSWSFEDTNFLSDAGDIPVSMANLANPASFDGNAVQVDSTNAAWLQYNIKDSTITNLTFFQGAIKLWVLPDWNSGSGPGSYGRLPELFEPGQPGTEDQEQLIAQLHQKIGQLTVDLDWLKKKSRQLGL